MDSIITDLTTEFTAYATAGAALLGAVIVFMVGAKFAKKVASRAS